MLGITYLFLIPIFFIKLAFAHLMLKFKRVEIMINPKYTLADQIRNELTKQMCLTRLVLFTLLFTPVLIVPLMYLHF